MRCMCILLSSLLLLAAAGTARADRQRIAPGTGSQSAVAVDSGADGICQTAAGGDDLQAVAVGQGAAFEPVVRCGADRLASSVAAGDDRQLVAVGGGCGNRNVVVIDSGPDGVANTAALGDDSQELAVGTAAARTPCVLTGGNGIVDTPDPVGGDDVRLLPAGTAEPNTAAVRCGPNQIADTRANNVRAGDDVQRVPQHGTCPNANAVVVDTGANGIADTRAEGPELTLRIARPLRITIPRRRGVASRTVKLVTRNVEWGPSAPATRTYQLFASDGSCPNATVTQVDADARAPGLQSTAAVPRGGQVKGRLVVTFRLEDVTTVDRRIPYRCAVVAEARAIDTAPAPDDAANTEDNEARVVIEVVDQADLPRR